MFVVLSLDELLLFHSEPALPALRSWFLHSLRRSRVAKVEAQPALSVVEWVEWVEGACPELAVALSAAEGAVEGTSQNSRTEVLSF